MYTPFRRILVATDLDDTTRVAIERALALVGPTDTSIIALHVLARTHEEGHWRSTLFAEDLARYHQLLEREELIARDRLRAQIADAARGSELAGDVDLLVRSGRPADTIVAVARELGADLIVVGTHGRQGNISSVAERVARSAPCPVLIVPRSAAAQSEVRQRSA